MGLLDLGIISDITSGISAIMNIFSGFPEIMRVIIFILLVGLFITLFEKSIDGLEFVAGTPIKPYLHLGVDSMYYSWATGGEGIYGCDYKSMPTCHEFESVKAARSIAEACVPMVAYKLANNYREGNLYLHPEKIDYHALVDKDECDVKWYYYQRVVQPPNGIVISPFNISIPIFRIPYVWEYNAIGTIGNQTPYMGTTWYYVRKRISNFSDSPCAVAADVCNANFHTALLFPSVGDVVAYNFSSASYSLGIDCAGYAGGWQEYITDEKIWEEKCYGHGFYILDVRFWTFIPMIAYIVNFALRYYRTWANVIMK